MKTSFDRAKIRKERMMTYFIEAADEIIRSEGLHAVTIRKAADLAGYTSATLYNYFDDVSHLIFLAAFTHIEPYYGTVPKATAWCENGLERCIAIMECFCGFVFVEPEIFEHLFFRHNDKELDKYMDQYYTLFPERMITDMSLSLSRFFKINNIVIRSQIQLDDCVEEGYMTQKNSQDFNLTTLMIFKCLLEKVKFKVITKEEATVAMLKSYSQLVYAYTKSSRYEDVQRIFSRVRDHAPEYLKEVYLLEAPYHDKD